MFSAFLIMLRETLEAVLIIGVLLGFLARNH
jgi:high-affinity Fe2+/Pb2+ permease